MSRTSCCAVYGVSDINYMGQRDYSIRAWLDPQKLASRNMTAMDVANAIREQNIDAPAGQIGQLPVARGQYFQLPIDTLGRLTNPEEFANIVVKVGSDRPDDPATGIVRLRDVARVELGAQNYNQSCTFDGKPSVGLSIYQLPGTNALDVADRVRAKMKELKTRFPDGVSYDIAYDTTPFIRESVRDVIYTLFEAVILVGIVVLVFLQDWKAMILPMIDVPVSLIGTFAFMAALGFSLNNLTLFGLVLAIGIVVDDAIVVLENTERMIAKGYDARTATIKAMEEITGPILAITLALSSVFIPCCFITGITGQFFRQFAVTIAVSTIISAVNALTMTPSRAVLIFKTEESAHGHEFKREALPWWSFGIFGGMLTVWYAKDFVLGQFIHLGLLAESSGAGLEAASGWMPWLLHHAAAFSPGLVVGLVVGWFIIRPVNAVLGWLFRGFNRLFDRMTGVYGWMVGKSLRMSVIVLMIYGGLLVLTYGTFKRAPSGFIPEQDQGRLILSVQLPDSASLQRTKEHDGHRRKDLPRDAGGGAHGGLAGMSFLLQANASNFGSMFIVLDPFDDRQAPELTANGIMARLRKEFKRQVKDADGRRAQFLGDPRPGHRRRLQAHHRGPRRSRVRGLAAGDGRAGGGDEEAAGPGHRIQPVPLPHAAALPGHRPDQGRIPGPVVRRRESDAVDVPGLALRQQLQPVRPPLASHGPVGGRFPQPGGGHQPAPGPEQVGADGATGHRWSACARRRRPGQRHAV